MGDVSEQGMAYKFGLETGRKRVRVGSVWPPFFWRELTKYFGQPQLRHTLKPSDLPTHLGHNAMQASNQMTATI